MKDLNKIILNTSNQIFEAIKYPKFFNIKRKTNGMLSASIYKHIYDLVYNLTDNDIVEIGGALGGASISMAKALRDSNKKSNLIVIEKCEGGSRTDIGNYNENLDLIKKNYKKFNVSKNISLFPKEITYENVNEIKSLIKTPNISAFMHDADGRVDRDFFHFWPILMDDGLIIIDDYVNKGKYLPITERHPQGGMKCVLTYRLLNQMIEWNLIKIDAVFGPIVFGHKPRGSNFDMFDITVCKKIVENVNTERIKKMKGIGDKKFK